jgi:hypothetical protein
MEAGVKVDYRDFEKKIKALKVKIPKIAKKRMVAALAPARRDAKRTARSLLKRRTGRLLRGINYWAFDDMSGALVTKKREVAKGVFYASTLEEGGTITAKEGKYLTFKIDGQWRKVQSVTIPPRPFMNPVFDDYFTNNSGHKAVELMDKKLQAEIDKAMEGGKK